MKTGYIKTHRSIQDCWIWNCEKYDKAHAWLDLLLDANHKDVKMLIDSKPTIVERGCLFTSKLNLAAKWRWDRKTVTSFLSILENDGMITQERYQHGTMITIVNYSRYQQSADNEMDTTTDNALDIGADIGADIGTDINKNDKNVKNEKKYIEKENIKEKESFSPPTIVEVAAYCRERNNGVDAVRFVSYYESVGWKVGKNKMKDWKAAVRTWERKDKQEHQAQPPQQQPGCIWSKAEQRWIPI